MFLMCISRIRIIIHRHCVQEAASEILLRLSREINISNIVVVLPGAETGVSDSIDKIKLSNVKLDVLSFFKSSPGTPGRVPTGSSHTRTGFFNFSLTSSLLFQVAYYLLCVCRIAHYKHLSFLYVSAFSQGANSKVLCNGSSGSDARREKHAMGEKVGRCLAQVCGTC